MARLAGALAVLDQQGYDTIVCNADTPEQRDHHLAALTARYRADGVMVVSVHLARQYLASFRRGPIPLVTVDTAATGVPQTGIDDVAGGRLATTTCWAWATAGSASSATSWPAGPRTSSATPRPGGGCTATGRR